MWVVPVVGAGAASVASARVLPRGGGRGGAEGGGEPLGVVLAEHDPIVFGFQAVIQVEKVLGLHSPGIEVHIGQERAADEGEALIREVLAPVWREDPTMQVCHT